MLKFFPGWGNVVCGMVAGAGTYAIGRAATASFLTRRFLKRGETNISLKNRRKRFDARCHLMNSDDSPAIFHAPDFCHSTYKKRA